MRIISDERFATMSMAFEEEQRQIKSSIPNMEQRLETETDKSDSLQRFIDKVKCVTQLTELTPEIVHEFIEKIVVSKPEYIDGKRHQNLKIYYNGVALSENHHQKKWKNCSKSICRTGQPIRKSKQRSRKATLST